MPRRKRSYLPGCAFHITARTHSGELWFEELRSEILAIIDYALTQTDALLLAFAIMTNHIHLVIRQGDAPLARLMQPIGQRTAYAVHRRYKRAGYVLGYRYFDTPCLGEAHLRNAIMYTHRNPVEAGLCESATDYEWSSARVYATDSEAIQRPSLYPAYELFASGLPDRTAPQDYSDFYAWYDTCKSLAPDAPRPHSPGVTDSDVYWLNNFAAKPDRTKRPSSDMRDIAMRILAKTSPAITLDLIRAASHIRPLAAIRDTIAQHALRAGHRPIDIANFLNTSDSTVSRARTRSTRPSNL